MILREIGHDRNERWITYDVIDEPGRVGRIVRRLLAAAKGIKR